MHRYIIHFPIALAVFALVYDAWAVSTRRSQLHQAGYGLSLWAALSAMLAVVTGLQIAGLGEISKGAITGHALFGISASITLAGFGLWRYSAKARQEGEEESYTTVWLIVQGLAALLVLGAAYTGQNL